MSKLRSDAGLYLLAIPILFWALFPIWHLFVLSISSQQNMLEGRFFPSDPTLRNYYLVFTQGHYYLSNFWLQLWNSFFIAAATGVITLFVATLAAFSISQLRSKGGRLIMNFALATYLIPAAFLAVPMYKTMGIYGILNSQWALIFAMVALASPYAIWVLKQASDKLPVELNEAAIIDGATVPQLFRLIYLPLMKPSLVAIGIYALLLAWNEYLYAFLMLANEKQVPLAVALGTFLGADDSPWNIMMATGFIYALPPVVIYYTFRKHMVSGLTAGAVKS
jgi:multiple sugar transport system permease protein